ncbi:MAG: ankyrin repeat domain-containing protein, partial [Pseudomonadota bacterium]
GHLDIVELLLDQGLKADAAAKYGGTALRAAASSGELDVVEFLAQRGAKLDAAGEDGNTALLQAAYHRHWDVVGFLADKGADVAKTDKNGWSALHYAADAGELKFAEMAIDGGCDVNAAITDGYRKGSTPLILAAEEDRLDMVKYLLTRGALIDAVNGEGQSALHRALLGVDYDMHGMDERVFIKFDLAVFEYLAGKGADLNIKDNLGRTVLDYAKEHDKKDVVELLESMGAL